jgi:DNA-binding transcriptional ArsR family regulator
MLAFNDASIYFRIMKPRRDVFQAVSDPTRREILSLLLKKSRNINSIANEFKMTRQAVSLHVKILSECEVISIENEGRKRYCSLNLVKVLEISKWLQPFRQIWEERFNRLDDLLKEMKNKSE